MIFPVLMEFASKGNKKNNSTKNENCSTSTKSPLSQNTNNSSNDVDDVEMGVFLVSLFIYL